MQLVLQLLHIGPYLRGLRDQSAPSKCSPQKFSTLFQHISAVAVVNIILLLYYEEVLYFLFTQSVLRHSKSAETASAAGASPGTRLEELRTLPKYPSRPGRGHPLPNLHPSTPHFSEPSEFFSCMDAQLYLLALDSRYLPGASQPPDRNFRLEPPLTGGHQR